MYREVTWGGWKFFPYKFINEQPTQWIFIPQGHLLVSEWLIGKMNSLRFTCFHLRDE